MTLALGYVLKRPCQERSWGAPEFVQYRTFCYNDIQPLYYARHLHEHAFPYIVETSYEYPPAIGIPMWLESFVAHDDRNYFRVNTLMLSAAALVSALALALAIGSRKAVLWFSAGPPLLLYGFLNWDLLAVAPLSVAAWAWRQRRWRVCGAMLGWGAAGKLFPAYVLPALAVALFLGDARGTRRVRNYLDLVISALAAWLCWNLPVIVSDYLVHQSCEGWLHVYAFHAGRFPDLGTVWFWFRDLAKLPILIPLGFTLISLPCAVVIPHRRASFSRLAFVSGLVAVLLWALSVSPATAVGPTSQTYKQLVDNLSLALFAGGSLWLLSHQIRQNRDPWAIGAATVALFLLVSKIHSPQYALWILPFFVLVHTPWPLMIAYFAADALLFASGFSLLLHAPDLQPSIWKSVFIFSVYLRATVLAALFGWYALEAGDRIRVVTHKVIKETVLQDLMNRQVA